MALKGAKGTVTIIDRATSPLRSIAKSFMKVGKDSAIANKVMSGTQKAIDGITKAQSRLGRVQNSINKKTSGLGNQAVGVLALGMAFKEILNPAIKFEQSMKDLEAVAFGSSDATVPVAKNMALLSEQARKLGGTTRYSAIQAGEGQLFLAKAGFKTNQIISAMPSLLDLASASGEELGQTSDILSDLLGAFGMTAKDTGKLADVMASATSSANVDMVTLFETLKMVAPVGISAGQSMEGIISATAILGNVGIKGSNAGTALKTALVNLASPASKGAKLLKSLGINVSDASGNMLPLQEIMMSLGKSAKNLSQVNRIKAFSGVFGKEAMAGAINLEKAVTSGDFAKMLKNLQNSEGVAKRMAKIRMDSTEGSIVQLMSALEGLAITFGSVLTPMIRGTSDVLATLTIPFQEVIGSNKEVIKYIGLFAGALLSAKIVALGYTSTLWLISPAITALSATLAFLKAPLLTFNLLMSANPVGAVVVGVMALVTAGVLLYKNWKPIGEFFSELWDTIKSFDFSNIMGSLSKIGSVFGIGSSGDDGKDGKDSGFFNSVSNLFSSDSDNSTNNSTNNNQSYNNYIAPQQAMQSINNNNTSNLKVIINNEDGRTKSINTTGAVKVDTFINNNGSQF